MKEFHVTLFISCVLLWFVHQANGHVVNVTEKNIDSLLNKKKFLLVLVTKSKCISCNRIFPKFWAASQSYSQDVVFARIKSKKLAEEYGVKTFPTLGYFMPGRKDLNLYRGDISVDTIVDLIANKMGTNFAYVMKQYSTQLDSYNFEGIISSPGLYAFVLLHDDKDDYFEKFEDLARVYKTDEEPLHCPASFARKRRWLD